MSRLLGDATRALLLDQERRMVDSFLVHFWTGFGGRCPVGCLAAPQGSVQAYGVPDRLLDVANRYPARDAEIREAVAAMVRHFEAEHVFALPDHPDPVQRSWDCPGETVFRHPVRSRQDYFDGDKLRHIDFRFLSLWSQYSSSPRVELCARLGLRLMRSTDPAWLRHKCVCDGGYIRALQSAGNLVYLWRVTGAAEFLDRAEALVYAVLSGTKRAPGSITPAPVECWAGSDELESGHQDSYGKWVWDGEMSAEHRSASAWHVGASVRFLLAVWEAARYHQVRELCEDWVKTWAAAAFYAPNGILRVGSDDPLTEDALARAAAEFEVPRVCGLVNWEWDGEGDELTSGYWKDKITGPGGQSIARRHYNVNRLPGTVIGPKPDWQVVYGWPDLFWIAYALTGQARYLDAARAILIQRRVFGNVAGEDTPVQSSRPSLDLWDGANASSGSAGRAFSWILQTGAIMEWWK